MAFTTPMTNQDYLHLFYKTYAPGVARGFYQTDPLMDFIEKKAVGGNIHAFKISTARGGVAGRADTAVASIGNYQAVYEFNVQKGKFFEAFNIDNDAELTAMNQGAPELPSITEFKLRMDNIRKALAGSLFKTGYGEIADSLVALASIANQGNVITISREGSTELEVGSTFQIAPGSPSAARGTGVYVVRSKQILPGAATASITFDLLSGVADASVAIGDWLVYQNSRNDADGSPRFPVGLAGWIPTVGNRTGAGWDTYIGTPFMGVNRSVDIDRLAGGFIMQESGDSILDTIIAGIELGTYKGSPDGNILVMNTRKINELRKELEAKGNYRFEVYRNADIPEYGLGMKKVKFAYLSTELGLIVPSTSCPFNMAYTLDPRSTYLYHYSNVGQIAKSGNGLDAGRDDPSASSYAGTATQLLLDNWITIGAPQALEDWYRTVGLNFYGNWAVENPTNACAIKFAD